jgi:hypothetical protein
VNIFLHFIWIDYYYCSSKLVCLLCLSIRGYDITKYHSILVMNIVLQSQMVTDVLGQQDTFMRRYETEFDIRKFGNGIRSLLLHMVHQSGQSILKDFVFGKVQR